MGFGEARGGGGGGGPWQTRHVSALAGAPPTGEAPSVWTHLSVPVEGL